MAFNIWRAIFQFMFFSFAEDCVPRLIDPKQQVSEKKIDQKETLDVDLKRTNIPEDCKIQTKDLDVKDTR